MSGNFSLYCGKRRSDLRARVGYLSVNYATRRNLRSRKKIIQLLPPWRIVPRERPVSLSHTAGPLRGRELSLYISTFLFDEFLRRAPSTFLPTDFFFIGYTVESSLPNGNLACRCLCLSLSFSLSLFLLLSRTNLSSRTSRALLISQSHSLQFFTIKVKISALGVRTGLWTFLVFS